MIYNFTPDQVMNYINNPKFAAVIALIAVWSLIWKGFALWKASHKEQKIWFVLLLGVNSVGILEILYIFWLNKYNIERKEKQY